jgi:alpha-glucosidase
MPVMRPAFFADPGDTNLRDEDAIFLLGRDLLIVPKWAEKPCIPDGFSAVISLLGEDSQCDPFQCDVRIRDGAVVPLTKVMQTTADFDHGHLSLMIRLAADGEASGKVYEDENEGFGYLDGVYRETTFFVTSKNQQLNIRRHIDGEFPIGARELEIIVVLDDGQRKFTVCESDEMMIRLDN